MEIQLGVACGRCDRYNVLGSEACACGQSLALAPPAPSGKAVAQPKAAAKAPASLFEQDVLKPRRVPAASSPGVPSAVPRPAARPTSGSLARAPSSATVRAQGGESAVSSAGAAPDEGPSGERKAGAEPSLEELMEQAKNYVCRSCSTPVPMEPQVLRAVRRGDPAGDPERAHAVLRAAADAGQGEAHPDPRRGGRGPELPAQRRAAHRRPQRPARLPRRSRSSRPGTRTSSTATASSSCATRARSTASSGACAAASRSQPGDHFLAGEQLFRIEGRPARTTGRRPTARTSTRRPSTRPSSSITQILQGGASGMAVCARGTVAADRARGRRPQLPGRPLHERVALQARGRRRQAHPHRPQQPQRHLRAPQGRARARPTATTCSSAASCCASRSRLADAPAASGRFRVLSACSGAAPACSIRAAPDAEPPRSRGVAVPPAARAQPGRLVPVGARGARAGEARGQADPPLHRLLRLPLVPRDGARVVRGRGDRALMNERFVNIKVDREERPDLDQVYQLVVQLMGRSGGWPLTVFLTPDQRPFFGGTYFPPGRPLRDARLPEGAPGASAEAYRARRDEVDAQAEEITQAIARVAAAATRRRRRTRSRPDSLGARGRASSRRASTTSTAASAQRPKFPNTMSLDVLLARRWASVRARAQGARRDARGRHLGPPRRRLPPLLDRRALARAALREDALRQRAAPAALRRRVARDAASARYAETARAIAAYVAPRDDVARTAASTRRRTPTARARRGSSSSGRRRRSTPRARGDDEAARVAEARVRRHRRGELRGERRDGALRGRSPSSGRGQRWRCAPRGGVAALERAPSGMFAAREKRAKPFRDEKILASWNGLMIGALADAGRGARRAALVVAAARALALRRAGAASCASRGGERACCATRRTASSKGPGFLDDHAFVADAALDLYEATGEVALGRARAVARRRDPRALPRRRSDGLLRLHARRRRGDPGPAEGPVRSRRARAARRSRAGCSCASGTLVGREVRRAGRRAPSRSSRRPRSRIRSG